ncbi:hypothetical protein EST38_g6768 [Candolleomyces aberdarensis]|uniref:Uncharacterized protein n=1 Tax=Candolleomyces aberdarensis TaxID=2316362 RepID=A0A4Q2DGU3_9AGAR|nr:hypothetical protein EST38_g6768 [Candolleomyces aberdarensis]
MFSDSNKWPTTWAEYRMLDQWFDETLPGLQFQGSSFQGRTMLVKVYGKYPEVWPMKARNWDRLDEYFQSRLQIEASTRNARGKGNSELGRHSVGWAAQKKLPQLKAELEDRLSGDRVTQAPIQESPLSARKQGCQGASLSTVQALPSATHTPPGAAQVRTPQPQPFPSLKRKLVTDQPLLPHKRVKVSSGQEPLAAPRPHVPVANMSNGLSIPRISNISRRPTPTSGSQQTRVPSAQANPSTSFPSSHVVPRDSQRLAPGAISNPNSNRTPPSSIGAVIPSGVQKQNSNDASQLANSQLRGVKQRFNTEILEAPPQQEAFSDQGIQGVGFRSGPMFGIQGSPPVQNSLMPAAIMSRTPPVASGAGITQMANPNSLFSSPNASVGAHPVPGPMFRNQGLALAQNARITPAGLMSGIPSSFSYANGIANVGPFSVQQQQVPLQIPRPVNQGPALIGSQGMGFFPFQQAVASLAGTQPVTAPEIIDLTTPPLPTEIASGSKNSGGAPASPQPTIPANAPAENIAQPEPDHPPLREVVNQVPEPVVPPRVKVYLPMELEDLFTEEFFRTFVTEDETGSKVSWGPSNEGEESSPSVVYPAAPADSSPPVEESKHWFPIAILDLSAENTPDSQSRCTAPAPPSSEVQIAVA